MAEKTFYWTEIIGGSNYSLEPGMLIDGGITKLVKFRAAGEKRDCSKIRLVKFDRHYVIKRIIHLLFKSLQQPNLQFYLDLVAEAWIEFNSTEDTV